MPCPNKEQCPLPQFASALIYKIYLLFLQGKSLFQFTLESRCQFLIQVKLGQNTFEVKQGSLEDVIGVDISSLKRPDDFLVKIFHRHVQLLGETVHHGLHSLA